MMEHRGLRFQFVWSDRACDKLRELWADGFSCSQIAAAMHGLFGGDITRNAVIGKVTRLGLPRRARSPLSSVPQPRKPRTRSTPFRRGIDVPKHAHDYDTGTEPEVLDSITPIGQRRTILELTDETCRWPIGDPGGGDFFFCGGQTVTGLPYCGYHGRIAYQPVNDRRRDRAPPQMREAAE